MIHVIAEAGNNHNGKIDRAYKLIDIAKEAGADSVKFQIIYPDGLYLPQVILNNKYIKNEVYEKRSANMLNDSDYKKLADHCRLTGIGFSASVFDEKGIKLLDTLDAPYIKIASCDLNNIKLLLSAAETGRKLIISTGMASLAEIEFAVTSLHKAGFFNIVLMHCVSLYPATTEQTNLPFIKTLKAAFGLPVGFSDHTEDSIAGVIAVAMGATWIEKHFTYDRSLEGFDHAYAMEPKGFIDYVKKISAAEIACQRTNTKLSIEEIEVKNRARRGIYAARDISPGDVIQQEDLIIVRPESEFMPNQINFILGRTAINPIKMYEAIKSGDI